MIFKVRIIWEGHKFCEISTLLLSTVHTDKSKVEILQNFVAFSDTFPKPKSCKTLFLTIKAF